jgi:acetolactate synthase I/II/III large subunit
VPSWRAAFRLASEERPGAVHLELPEDIAADDASELTPFEPIMKRRPIAEDKGALPGRPGVYA